MNSLKVVIKKGYYDTMDVGYKSKEGYITVLSRADDVINVAGHRISAGAIEEAILDNEYLADCAVVSLKDQLKGDVPFAFVCVTINYKGSEKEIIDSIVKSVRDSIGPVASFKQAVIVKRLPKTRSGKIARNCLKAMLNNESFKVTTKKKSKLLVQITHHIICTYLRLQLPLKT